MEYYIKAYKVIPENIDLLLNIQGVFSSQDNLEKAFYYAELAEKIAKKPIIYLNWIESGE